MEPKDNKDSTKKQKSNSAKAKLKNQPFRTVTEKKEFADKIRRDVLGRLEYAKAMEEFTNEPEYQFYKDRFKKGMTCRYGEDTDDIVSVSLTDEGIEVLVSEKAKGDITENERHLLGQLVQSTSRSLISSYYESLGYLPKNPDVNNPFDGDSGGGQS